MGLARKDRICLVALLLGMAGQLPGQSASIQGIVSDSTGAVIADVQITVEQVTTGTRIETRTNNVGLYSLPSLAIGQYVVSGVKPGFQTFRSADLKLTVGQAARVDFVMTPAGVTEQITISATAPPLDTETTMMGQVINNRSVVDLPLNGRNYLQLAQLTSGTGPAIGSRQAAEGAFSASGQHGWQINVLLDGMDNNSRASGGQLGYEAQAVKPSVDAVEEFRVVTNNMSAEYGFRMGGTVLVSMKSGTNQFHGSAFEFLRNSKLDAANFFANRNGSPKPIFKRNQFGATLGGPVIRDRTFFFGSFEGTRIRSGNSFVSTVPTLEMRQGDFSRVWQIFDPATTTGTGSSMTRSPFPGNRIPQSRWDPVFAKLQTLYPAPADNSKTVNNYFYSPVEKSRTDSYDAKIDHNIGSSTRLTGRYSVRQSDYLQPGPLPLPADGGLWTTVELRGHNFVTTLTKTLSPSLTNEFRVGFSRVRSVLDIPYDRPLYDDYGIRNVPKVNDPSANDHGLTRFTPQGYAELGSRSYWPSVNDLDYLQISDVLFKVRGNHNIKAGFDVRRERVVRTASRFARGQYAFNREFTADPKNRARTGDGFAEFMLGDAAGGSLGNGNPDDVIAKSVDGFIQDNWRITRSLTLNLGVRYDVFLGVTYPSYADGSRNQVSNFVLDFSSIGANVQLKQVRPRNDGDCGCRQDLNNFAPRVGLAWQANSKTVIRSGFGLIYGQADNAEKQTAVWAVQAPDYVETSFATLDRIHPLMTLRDGLPSIQIPSPAVPGPAKVGINAREAFLPTQYSEQWFFDVQRELPLAMTVTLGYAGNGTHKMIGGFNHNLPVDGPSPVPVAQRRVWPYYTSVSSNLAFGNLSYNAFTFRLDKRFSRGLQFLSAYTWAHTIDNVVEDNNDVGGQGSVNPYNRQLDRGNAVNDIRHNFVYSGTYELPFGKGQRWQSGSRVVNTVLGGWQFSGILTMRTGAPFAITSSGGLTNAGGTDRPNRIRDGALPSDQRSIDRWYDVSAFPAQAQYTYGNTGRNVLHGPNLSNLDLTLSKSFQVRESMRLQLRLESFNASNTPAFGQPNGVANGPAAGTITSAGDPRRVQFGLKLLW